MTIAQQTSVCLRPGVGDWPCLPAAYGPSSVGFAAGRRHWYAPPKVQPRLNGLLLLFGDLLIGRGERRKWKISGASYELNATTHHLPRCPRVVVRQLDLLKGHFRVCTEAWKWKKRFLWRNNLIDRARPTVPCSFELWPLKQCHSTTVRSPSL